MNLVDETIAESFLPHPHRRLPGAGCPLRGDPKRRAILPGPRAAPGEDPATELPILVGAAGISAGHPRAHVLIGLEKLTATRFAVIGEGQVRE